MKIVVIGATGNIGRRIVKEALSRGHEVTGVIRDPERGERRGTYRTTGDQLLADAAGKSFITFEDYAVAVLDELERPMHTGRRFGVAY